MKIIIGLINALCIVLVLVLIYPFALAWRILTSPIYALSDSSHYLVLAMTRKGRNLSKPRGEE